MKIISYHCRAVIPQKILKWPARLGEWKRLNTLKRGLKCGKRKMTWEFILKGQGERLLAFHWVKALNLIPPPLWKLWPIASRKSQLLFIIIYYQHPQFLWNALCISPASSPQFAAQLPGEKQCWVTWHVMTCLHTHIFQSHLFCFRPLSIVDFRVAWHFMGIVTGYQCDNERTQTEPLWECRPYWWPLGLGQQTAHKFWFWFATSFSTLIYYCAMIHFLSQFLTELAVSHHQSPPKQLPIQWAEWGKLLAFEGES